MSKSGTVQRAYELAAESRSLDEIRAKLRAEGFDAIDAHLSSAVLRADLKKRMAGRGS